jgi:phosphoribosylformylglycinamidine (FGAM) synthase-like enzyme
MSVLEIWGAEYQENDCLLIKPESRDLLQAICDRERCFMQVGVQDLVDAVSLHVACGVCVVVWERCFMQVRVLGANGSRGIV